MLKILYMINRLKAIIIDSLCSLHDYSLVKSVDKLWNNSERGFDLILLDNISNIDEILWENKDFDSIITICENENCEIYNNFCQRGFQFRKKWCNFNEFNSVKIANAIIGTFFTNMTRDNGRFPLFSFFTCTFNTPKEKIERLYSSIVSQEYIEWDWFILDDSTDDSVINIIESFNDYRITIIRNSTNHGSIGFNKHAIAMMCDGDYLVEVDHDDELTCDCLKYLKMAFETYKDTDFVYSESLELAGDESIIYCKGWGFGEGKRGKEIVNGVEYEKNIIPEVNPFSIRTIYSQPNHVRCWKKSFYHLIGGHNTSFSVMDDCELIIRTFLNGKMTKIDKILYIQHEDKGKRGESGNNTQSIRYGEIQRFAWYLKRYYDKKIHERILELGFTDYAWNENRGESELWRDHEPGLEVMSNLLKV